MTFHIDLDYTLLDRALFLHDESLNSSSRVSPYKMEIISLLYMFWFGLSLIYNSTVISIREYLVSRVFHCLTLSVVAIFLGVLCINRVLSAEKEELKKDKLCNNQPLYSRSRRHDSVSSPFVGPASNPLCVCARVCMCACVCAWCFTLLEKETKTLKRGCFICIAVCRRVADCSCIGNGSRCFATISIVRCAYSDRPSWLRRCQGWRRSTAVTYDWIHASRSCCYRCFSHGRRRSCNCCDCSPR